jgi:hypothetical protein
MKLSKKEIEMCLELIKNNLETAVSDAQNASAKYSDDIHSRNAFECGFLNGRIKDVLSTINQMEK